MIYMYKQCINIVCDYNLYCILHSLVSLLCEVSYGNFFLKNFMMMMMMMMVTFSEYRHL